MEGFTGLRPTSRTLLRADPGPGDIRDADPCRCKHFRPYLQAILQVSTALPSQVTGTRAAATSLSAASLLVAPCPGTDSPMPLLWQPSSSASMPLSPHLIVVDLHSKQERSSLMAIKFPLRILDSDPSILLCRHICSEIRAAPRHLTARQRFPRRSSCSENTSAQDLQTACTMR